MAVSVLQDGGAASPDVDASSSSPPQSVVAEYAKGHAIPDASEGRGREGGERLAKWTDGHALPFHLLMTCVTRGNGSVSLEVRTVHCR